MTTPAAAEDPGNTCWSPIDTVQRHYRLAVPGVRHSSVVVVTGLQQGEAYAYPGDDAGQIADGWRLTKADAGGDAAALRAIGYRLVTQAAVA